VREYFQALPRRKRLPSATPHLQIGLGLGENQKPSEGRAAETLGNLRKLSSKVCEIGELIGFVVGLVRLPGQGTSAIAVIAVMAVIAVIR